MTNVTGLPKYPRLKYYFLLFYLGIRQNRWSIMVPWDMLTCTPISWNVNIRAPPSRDILTSAPSRFEDNDAFVDAGFEREVLRWDWERDSEHVSRPVLHMPCAVSLVQVICVLPADCFAYVNKVCKDATFPSLVSHICYAWGRWSQNVGVKTFCASYLYWTSPVCRI